MRHLIFFLALFAVEAFAHDSKMPLQKAHCAFTMNPDDWPLMRLGSASAAIKIVEENCELGDHVMISRLYTDEASYFIATMCDPSFAITALDLGNDHTSVNCVYVGEMHDRLE